VFRKPRDSPTTDEKFSVGDTGQFICFFGDLGGEFIFVVSGGGALEVLETGKKTASDILCCAVNRFAYSTSLDSTRLKSSKVALP
jgi:hypothetical protein